MMDVIISVELPYGIDTLGAIPCGEILLLVIENCAPPPTLNGFGSVGGHEWVEDEDPARHIGVFENVVLKYFGQ